MWPFNKKEKKILFHFPNHWLNWNKQLIQCVFRLPNQNQMMRKFNFQQPKTDMVVISNPEPEKSILIKSISKNQLYCSVILIRSIRFDAFWFYEKRENHFRLLVHQTANNIDIRYVTLKKGFTRSFLNKQNGYVKNSGESEKYQKRKWKKMNQVIETESISTESLSLSEKEKLQSKNKKPDLYRQR